MFFRGLFASTSNIYGGVFSENSKLFLAVEYFAEKLQKDLRGF